MPSWPFKRKKPVPALTWPPTGTTTTGSSFWGSSAYPYSSSLLNDTDQMYVQTLWPVPPKSGRCEKCGERHYSVSDAYDWHARRLAWLMGCSYQIARILGRPMTHYIKKEQQFLEDLAPLYRP